MGGKLAGPWTHVKRQPVRTYTAAEIEAFVAEREIPRKPGPA